MFDPRRSRMLPGAGLVLGACLTAGGCLSFAPGRNPTTFSSEQQPRATPTATTAAPSESPVKPVAFNVPTEWTSESGGIRPAIISPPPPRVPVAFPLPEIKPMVEAPVVSESEGPKLTPPPITIPSPSGPTGIASECNRVTVPYVIGPPDVLQVDSLKGLINQPVNGARIVRPDGTVGLGTYGSVMIAGLTIEQAREAIAQAIHARLDPKVVSLKDVIDGLSVELLANNSRFYYVIFDAAGQGEQVMRFPLTGSDTVLDAISQALSRTPAAALAPAPAGRRVWVARRSCAGKNQILPVDWAAVTQRGQGDTNYQLLSGDRIYVRAEALRPVYPPAPTPAPCAPVPASQYFGSRGVGLEYRY